MKKLLLISTFLSLFIGIGTAQFGPVQVGKKAITSITDQAIVKTVISINIPKDSVSDIALLFHQTALDHVWGNFTGTARFFSKSSGDSIFLDSRDGTKYTDNDVNYYMDGVDSIAIWFDINVTGKTYSVYAQKRDSAAPRLLFTDFGFRHQSTAIDSVSIVYNDKLPWLSDKISFLEEPTIVTEVEAHDFGISGGGGGTATQENIAKNISIYPTVANNVLNIASDDMIQSVQIFSITGVELINEAATKVVDIADLNAGTYLVQVTNSNGQLYRSKIIKR